MLKEMYMLMDYWKIKTVVMIFKHV